MRFSQSSDQHVILILELNDRGDETFVAMRASADGLALPSGRVDTGESVEDAAARMVGEAFGGRLTVTFQPPFELRVAGFPTRVEALYAASPVPGLTPVAVEVVGTGLRRSLAQGLTAVPLKQAQKSAVRDWHRRFLSDYPARKRYKNPTPTVDIVIRIPGDAGDRIVLVWRNQRPFGWAVPGGFGEYRLRYEQTAHKEAMEETGLVVVLDGICGVYSDADRDPERLIRNTASVVYAAHVEGRQAPRAGSDAGKLGLFDVAALEAYADGTADSAVGDLIEGDVVLAGEAAIVREPEHDLCFDHAKILRDYFRRRPDRLLEMEGA